MLGDVIPRKLSALADGMALLKFGSQEGFYGQALRGLIRTRFSALLEAPQVARAREVR